MAPVRPSVAAPVSPAALRAKSPGKPQPIRMKIDDQWYDATGWAKAHPGGARFIEYFDGRDATDAFYALHSYFGVNGSSEATDRLAKLPKCDPPPNAALPNTATAAACTSFREFRYKLEQDGWFERNPLMEAAMLANVVGLCAAGTALAHEHPLVGTLLLSLGMQQAGWLGHDYIHGRGWWCEMMKVLGTVVNGHSSEWWTQKHSMHHVFTNEHAKDEDITQEPFFFLEHPEVTGAQDSPLRRYQHLYAYPLYMFTFWLWRVDSLRDVVARRDKKDAALLALNALWMACLPWQVVLGSVTLGGFLVGSIVSATHQSEEVMFEQGEYVDVQFRSTRDAEAENAFVKYIWGGMDTQLEHHLFPTMPRYKYHKLRPLLKAFADGSGEFQYLISPASQIIADNYATLKAKSQS